MPGGLWGRLGRFLLDQRDALRRLFGRTVQDETHWRDLCLRVISERDAAQEAEQRAVRDLELRQGEDRDGQYRRSQQSDPRTIWRQTVAYRNSADNSIGGFQLMDSFSDDYIRRIYGHTPRRRGRTQQYTGTEPEDL